jgi:predicted nucleic acid-binding protein
MKKQRVYLDTSVFMAEFDKKDIRHETLNNFFKEITNLKDIELCTSKWALTELNNRLTKDQIKELKITKYIKDILDKNKIRTQKLKILNTHPKEHYTFHDFFSDLSKDLIKYKTGKERPGLGDIIHVRIMKNNRISTIITFDADFEKISGFTCLNLMKGLREEK